MLRDNTDDEASSEEEQGRGGDGAREASSRLKLGVDLG
jgi:hypothetical protein